MFEKRNKKSLSLSSRQGGGGAKPPGGEVFLAVYVVDRAEGKCHKNVRETRFKLTF